MLWQDSKKISWGNGRETNISPDCSIFSQNAVIFEETSSVQRLPEGVSGLQNNTGNRSRIHCQKRSGFIGLLTCEALLRSKSPERSEG
jgi:hypothetical protein